MPNIAAVFKGEISRIARKEVKLLTQDFKKASSQYRTQIAALRRRVDTLEQQVRRAGKAAPARAAAPVDEDAGDGQHLRFSAKRFAAQRQKLGLSAADFAALLGVSGQSVYKWELGKARPRQAQLAAIASLRGVGKREAAARLEALAK